MFDEDTRPMAAAAIMGPVSKETIDDLASRLVDLRKEKDFLTEEIKKIELTIMSIVEEEPGERTLEGEQFTLGIDQQESYKWDSEGLIREAYGCTPEHPLGIELTAKISKKNYLRLDPEKTMIANKYLVIKAGPPKIKVTDISKPSEEVEEDELSLIL